jgi:hypothetical protein
MIRRLLVVALLLLTMVSCSGGNDDSESSADRPSARPTTTAGADPDDAREAFLQQLQYLSDGQYGRAWEAIHPAQQAFVPRDLYIRCAEDRLAGLEVLDADVKEVFTEKHAVEGTELEVDSVAITVALKFRASGVETEDTETFHIYFVDGTWRISVTGADSYKQGECPA